MFIVAAQFQLNESASFYTVITMLTLLAAVWLCILKLLFDLCFCSVSPNKNLSLQKTLLSP